MPSTRMEHRAALLIVRGFAVFASRNGTVIRLQEPET